MFIAQWLGSRTVAAIQFSTISFTKSYDKYLNRLYLPGFLLKGLDNIKAI